MLKASAEERAPLQFRGQFVGVVANILPLGNCQIRLAVLYAHLLAMFHAERITLAVLLHVLQCLDQRIVVFLDLSLLSPVLHWVASSLMPSSSMSS